MLLLIIFVIMLQYIARGEMMNNNELKQARKKYRLSLKENNKKKDRIKEIEELKLTKEVMRFLELSDMNNELKSDKQLLDEAFCAIGYNTKDSNDKYVFMGSYIRDCLSGFDTILSKNASWSHYNIYWNLETEEKICIFKDMVENFENNNHVIDNNVCEPITVNSYVEYVENFYRIQSLYYKALTYTTMDDALVKIRKIYN